MSKIQRLVASAIIGLGIVLLIKPLQLLALGVMGVLEGEAGWWGLIHIAGLILSLIITIPTILCMWILPIHLVGEGNNAFFGVTFVIWAGVAFLVLRARERQQTARS
jgi:hypothetical protein